MTRRAALWLAWLLPLALYLVTAHRSVGYWDTGEMDTVPWMLGIAHPTGFPAYVLSGWLFSHAFALGGVAFRMSVFAALAMSATAWFVAKIVDGEYDIPWAALACALLFAFGQIAWTRGTRAEVHALAVAAIAATIWCALRWYRTGESRALIGSALCWGFGIAVHPVTATIAPGLLALAIARRGTLRARTLAVAAVCCVLIVTAFYAYLPLRSAYVSAHALDPAQALGLGSGAFWNSDGSSSLAGFRALVIGAGFDVGRGVRALVSPTGYVASAGAYLDALFYEFTPIGATLALLGIATSFMHDRARALALLLFALVGALFAIGYASEEVDVQRYFLTSFVVAAIFVGDACAWFARETPRWKPLAAVVVASCAAFLLWSHRDLFRQPYDDSASQTVAAVLRVTPPNAIVISSWTYATPLAYAAYVEHATGQRTILAAWLYDVLPHLQRWTKERPVYVVDPRTDEAAGFTMQKVLSDPTVYRVRQR